MSKDKEVITENPNQFTPREKEMLTNSLDGTIAGISNSINQSNDAKERLTLRGILDEFRSLQRKVEEI